MDKLFALTHSNPGMGLKKGTIMIVSTDHNPQYDFTRADTARTGQKHIAMKMINGDDCVYSIPVSVIIPYHLNTKA